MKVNDSIVEVMLEKLSDIPAWMLEGECTSLNPDDPEPLDPMWRYEADQVIEKLCSVCKVKTECDQYAKDIIESQDYPGGRKIIGVLGGVDYRKR